MINDDTPPHFNPESPWALFLDIDGTLLELKPTPADVVCEQSLKILLKDICTFLRGGLALISGRSLSSIDQLFSPYYFAAAGAHGFEIRPGPGKEIIYNRASQNLAPARHALESFAARYSLPFEDKSGALTLHLRQYPELTMKAEIFCEHLAHQYQLRLIKGNKVFDLVTPGINKGTAIARLMSHSPFYGRQPCFIGDDSTDDDGFHEINRRGGISILVGNRISEARYRLTNVAAVHRWLTDLRGINYPHQP